MASLREELAEKREEVARRKAEIDAERKREAEARVEEEERVEANRQKLEAIARQQQQKKRKTQQQQQQRDKSGAAPLKNTVKSSGKSRGKVPPEMKKSKTKQSSPEAASSTRLPPSSSPPPSLGHEPTAFVSPPRRNADHGGEVELSSGAMMKTPQLNVPSFLKLGKSTRGETTSAMPPFAMPSLAPPIESSVAAQPFANDSSRLFATDLVTKPGAAVAVAKAQSLAPLSSAGLRSLTVAQVEVAPSFSDPPEMSATREVDLSYARMSSLVCVISGICPSVIYELKAHIGLLF